MSPAGTNKIASIGIGFYTVPEAARLLKIAPLNIRRWLGGYTYGKGDDAVTMPPLWQPKAADQGNAKAQALGSLLTHRPLKCILKRTLRLVS